MAQLLGLAGLLPQHPDTYVTAWRNRQAMADPEQRRDNVVLRTKNDVSDADDATAQNQNS